MRPQQKLSVVALAALFQETAEQGPRQALALHRRKHALSSAKKKARAKKRAQRLQDASTEEQKKDNRGRQPEPEDESVRVDQNVTESAFLPQAEWAYIHKLALASRDFDAEADFAEWRGAREKQDERDRKALEDGRCSRTHEFAFAAAPEARSSRRRTPRKNAPRPRRPRWQRGSRATATCRRSRTTRYSPRRRP